MDVCRLFPLNSFITALEPSFLNDCFNSHKLLVPPLVTQALLPGQRVEGGRGGQASRAYTEGLRLVPKPDLIWKLFLDGTLSGNDSGPTFGETRDSI